MLSYGLKTWMNRLLGRTFRRGLGNYAHRHYIDVLKEKYESTSSYSDLCAIADKRTPIRASCNIRCHEDLGCGCSLRGLAARIGKPHDRIYRLNELTEVLAIYRFQWSGYKVRNESHFSKDGLFYFNRTFSHIAREEVQPLLKTLEDKYCGGQSIDFQKEKIVDEQGSEIVINRNLVLSLDYLCKSSPAFAALRTLQEREEMPRNPARHDLDMLYRRL